MRAKETATELVLMRSCFINTIKINKHKKTQDTIVPSILVLLFAGRLFGSNRAESKSSEAISARDFPPDLICFFKSR